MGGVVCDFIEGLFFIKLFDWVDNGEELGGIFIFASTGFQGFYADLYIFSIVLGKNLFSNCDFAYLV